MIQRHQFEHGSGGEKMDTSATPPTAESDRVFATSVPRPWASPKETRKTFATDSAPKSQTFISTSRPVTHTRTYGDAGRTSEPTSSAEEIPAKTTKYEHKPSPIEESQFKTTTVREWYDSRQKEFQEPIGGAGLRSVSEQSASKTDEAGGTTVASYGFNRDEKAPPPSRPLPYSQAPALEKRSASVEKSSEPTTKPSDDLPHKEIETKRPREESPPIETGGPSVKAIKSTYEQFSSVQRSTDSESERNREVRPITAPTTDYIRKEVVAEVPKGEDQADRAYRGMSTFDATALRREEDLPEQKKEEQTSFHEYTGKHAKLPADVHERENEGFSRSKTIEEEKITTHVRSPHQPMFYRTQSSGDEGKGIEVELPTHELRKSAELLETTLEEPSKRTAEFMRTKDEDDRRFEKMGLITAGTAATAVRKSSSSSSSSSKSSSADEKEKEVRKVTPPQRKETPPQKKETPPQRKETPPEATTTSPSVATVPLVRDQQQLLEGELSPATKRRIQEQSLRKASDLRESDIPITTQLSSDSQASATVPKSPALSQKSQTKLAKPFEFGKSKFTTKHEVIKRGKDVEVKLEHLKLSKEELKVIVIVPSKSREKSELIPKVKKVRNGYEISFKPTEVGTHKIIATVNDSVHPQSPFAIRVYDAGEIEIGSIPNECFIGDSVEFTVDAGRAGFGNLEIAIKDSDGVIIPSHVSQMDEGTAKFLVTFNPAHIGMHTVNITFNKEILKSSPFEVNVKDDPRLPPVVLEQQQLQQQQSQPQSQPQPQQQQTTVKETKSAAIEERRGSKTAVTAVPSATMGDFPSMARVRSPVTFVVATKGAPGKLSLSAAGPDGDRASIKVVEEDEDVKKIEFVPKSVGDHSVQVKFADMDVRGSPFTCRVYDPAKIRVGDIPNGLIDKPVHFIVDASEAGVGNLEVAVNEGRVPSMAHSLGQHRYDISFVPRDSEDYTISIRFNNDPVPGSPFTCKILSSMQVTATGPGLERVAVGKSTHFNITIQDGNKGPPPVVNIIDPHGDRVKINVQKVPSEGSSAYDDSFQVEYTPQTVGNHQIEIDYAGEQISGSPFTAKAYDSKCAKLFPVEGCVVGRPSTFIIDAARAGAGNMEIIVSVDGRNVPNFVQAEGQAKFKVSFTPQEAKEHVVSVRFNGEAIPGSPMKCTITAEESKTKVAGLTSAAKEVMMVGDIEEGLANEIKGFVVQTGGRRGDCNVVVTDPSGGPVPVKCYRQQDDSFWVEFTPQEIGSHTIEVTFADAPIAGSPFHCEVVDPKRVKIIAPPTPLVLRQEANIKLNRQGAGKGELTVEVTDPSGSPVPIDTLRSPSGDDRISFLPTKLGEHKINVKMSGFQVQGSPQTIIVEEAGKPRAFGSALDKAVQVGQVASLTFDSKKTKGGLKVEVKGPKNKVKHTTSKKNDGIFDISFTPQEVGEHQVNISWNDKPISGSPYTVSVVDAEKIEISKDSLDNRGNLVLTVFQRKEIDVDATAAGPGKLRAEVRGPNGTMVPGVQCQSLGYGKHRVTLVPRDAGEHSLFLFWSDLPVATANPISGWAESDGPIVVASTSRTTAVIEHISTESKERAEDDEQAEHLRVVLKGEGLTRGSTKEPAEFIIDGSDTEHDGQPACRLMGQKADVPIRVTSIGNRVYKATYTPLIAGKYELEVLWEGRQVRGSPFRVDVAAMGEADNILVDSESLRLGIVHDEVKTTIDTRRAGPGQLSAQCMGPSKLTYCELYDHRDGTYTLCIRPSEVGKHTLIVKYSGEHVPGSPFTVYISHPPDPSKVRVYGPGVEHGILSRYKSNFVVETKGAGAGQLTVRVRGPKGAFNVEMQRERKQDRTIHCKYEPREPGDYQVEVKWHGEHVPGSPFFVMIFDTQQELERFLSGQPPSPQPPTPFVPPGWMGPPPPGVFLPPGPPPPLHGHPPMLSLPPPPSGPPIFPQHGMPYSSSTLHSARSSRIGGKKQTSNGY